MVTRVGILSQSDKLILKTFITKMTSILNGFTEIKYNEQPQYRNLRLIIINKVLKESIKQKNLLLDKKFGCANFITVLKERIMYINDDILSEDNIILTQQNIKQYKKYSTRILQIFDPLHL